MMVVVVVDGSTEDDDNDNVDGLDCVGDITEGGERGGSEWRQKATEERMRMASAASTT